MRDIYPILKDLTLPGAGGVLATIIRVEGSAYKKEGACMLFKKDGSQIGLLSAGCLEEDIAERIRQGSGKRPERLVYDMRTDDEISWGEASGCNGLIEVLLEPVSEVLQGDLIQLKSHLDNGQTVMQARMLTENQQVGYLYMTDEQELFGQWHGAVPEEVQNMLDNPVRWNTQHAMYANSDNPFSFYFQCFRPKPRLFVFGAGKDAVPLVELAGKVGFSVMVADWRSALCNKTYFPTAGKLYIGFPAELLQQITFTPQDYAILLTHNFQKDKEILTVLKDQKLRYLGVLGSARRTARLLDKQEVPPHIISPIGLSIGAEGPEEIAVSVVSQLIKLSKESLTKEVHLCETT